LDQVLSSLDGKPIILGFEMTIRWDSFLTILFFVPLGAFGPALLVQLGPKTGLRTMTISRYAFGLVPGGVIAFVNVLTCIGWAMVTTMAGAEVFYSLSNTKVPLEVCILILSIVCVPFLRSKIAYNSSYVISFLGYRWIHLYEKWSWIVMFAFFIILAGFSGRYMYSAPMLSGQTEMADVMSFGAVVLGSSITWGPFSADYATYMKDDTSKLKLFTYTYLGLPLPLLLFFLS
jgi:purine-cytosine permease-like protein